MSDRSYMPAWRALLIREAIASVAMEHPAACPCTVCRANRGDRDAVLTVFGAHRPRPQ